jgi:transglutaminase-like putative cysteine protease
MKLRVSHLSRYEYAQPVSFSPHMLYLRPRENPHARVSKFTYNVSPQAKLTDTLDAFGNVLTWAHFWDRASALSIRTEFQIETAEKNPFDFVLRADAANYPFNYDAYERYMLAPYLALPAPEAQNRIQHWLGGATQPRESVPLVANLNQLLYSRIAYERREDPGIQDVILTLERGAGACRDYATALMQICRIFGIAARYVTGYLYTSTEDDHRNRDAMHSWVEVYLPGAGWKGVDPAHGIFCTDAYIAVAHAPQGECISPVQGSYYSSVRVPSQLTTNVLVEKLED